MTENNEQPVDDGRPPEHRRGEGDYYLTPGEENRIIAKLLACKRWKATDQHKEAALGVTVRNMANDDGRVSNAAVSNLIKMESQNQADDHRATPQIHDHRYTITIEEQTHQLAEIDEYLGSGGVVVEEAGRNTDSDSQPAIAAD